MARVRIDFRGPVVFTAEVRVRISDLNYGNHLGHDALVSLLHEARARFFRSLGGEEHDTEGRALVVVDLAVRYLSEAFLGQVLRVEVAAGEVGSRGCELLYRVIDRDDGRVVAVAKTGVVFISRSERRVVPVPAVVRSALESEPS